MTPTTLAGWAALSACLWGMAAYTVAAIAGMRAIRHAYAGRLPGAPLCILADATRWVFGLPMRGDLRPRDYIALGVSLAVLASIANAIWMLDYVSRLNWAAVGHLVNIKRALTDGLAGSALIILHFGVAYRFKRGGY